MNETFWILLTVGTYVGAGVLYQRFSKPILLHPVLVTALAIIVSVKLSGTPPAFYRESSKVLRFFLGPCVVALALPLHQHWERLAKSRTLILSALGLGSLLGVTTGVGLAWLLGVPQDLLIALAPKSVTSPIAMGIASQTGGSPELAALFVLFVGIFGAVTGPWLFRRLRIRSPLAQGLALGAGAHGVGTARATELGSLEAAASSLALGIMGLWTAIWIPLFWHASCSVSGPCPSHLSRPESPPSLTPESHTPLALPPANGSAGSQSTKPEK